MDDESVRKLLREFTDEVSRNFEIVAEGIRHENQIVAEGVLRNTEQISQIGHQIDGINTRLDGIDVRLAGHDARFDAIDTRLDGIDTRLDGIDTRLDGIGTRLDRLDTELHRESEEIRSMIRLSFSEIDRRIRTLEDTVARMQTRMDDIESRMPN